MDKETLATKKQEAQINFAQLHKQRQDLIQQLTEIDFAINRAQGEYTAYDSLIKDIETSEAQQLALIEAAQPVEIQPIEAKPIIADGAD